MDHLKVDLWWARLTIEKDEPEFYGDGETFIVNLRHVRHQQNN